MSLKDAAACVQKHNNFLITVHTNPEGDALGSELAFYKLVKSLGKNAVIINEDALPYGYDFLPGTANIKTLKHKVIKSLKFDCLVVLDCSDLRRTGDVYKLNEARHSAVFNIDHHISNSFFGDVNWVSSGYSSCSEMIYVLYKRLGLKPDKDAALCLYTGILTDTGSFHYGNTTGFTHRIASELLNYGFSAPWVYRKVYENINFSDIKLLLRLLPQLRRCACGKIAWFEIPWSILKNKRVSFDLSDSLLGFVRSIKGVEAAAVFKENLGVKDEIRVNLRSQGALDVNKIAQSFGGGGHKAASGITMYGKLKSVRQKVIARIKEAFS